MVGIDEDLTISERMNIHYAISVPKVGTAV
jgi:hypothetical protein